MIVFYSQNFLKKKKKTFKESRDSHSMRNNAQQDSGTSNKAASC